MNTSMLSIVIPAYNEEANIGPTISEIQTALNDSKIPYEIIVVNDCSQDNTAGVVGEFCKEDDRIKVVDRTPPGGFGRAVRTGLEHVQGEVIAIYMADQSDEPADLISCYQKIEEGYDCVFGSRFIKGSKLDKYPFGKLIANRIANMCIKLMFWCKFNDLTNAFKVYRTDVVRECGPYSACHFNITIEMSLSALIRRYNIIQIPISWHGRTWGSSNLRIHEMGRRYLEVLLKIFFERMLISDDIIAEQIANEAKSRRKSSGVLDRVKELENRIAEIEGKDSPE